jgi:hypothetical protein
MNGGSGRIGRAGVDIGSPSGSLCDNLCLIDVYWIRVEVALLLPPGWAKHIAFCTVLVQVLFVDYSVRLSLESLVAIDAVTQKRESQIGI